MPQSNTSSQTTLTLSRGTEQQWACISIELFSPTHTLCIQHRVKKKINLIIHLFFLSGWWWSNFKGSGALCCVEGILRDSLLCSCQAAHTVNHTMNRLHNNNSPARSRSKLIHTHTQTYTTNVSKRKHLLPSTAKQGKNSHFPWAASCYMLFFLLSKSKYLSSYRKSDCFLAINSCHATIRYPRKFVHPATNSFYLFICLLTRLN